MITIAKLCEVLHYNQESGVFTWRVQKSNRVSIGDIAGAINGAGYRMIGIYGRRYCAHRLAWLYVTGAWPERQIDHVNLDGADNRLINLREATSSQNLGNRRMHKNNLSGFKGVIWARFRSGRGKWRAKIRIDGNLIHLGYFNTREEAHAAYVAAAVRYFGDFARAA